MADLSESERERIARQYGVAPGNIPSSVTECPPCTFSPGAWEPVPLKQSAAHAAKLRARQERLSALRRSDMLEGRNAAVADSPRLGAPGSKANPKVAARRAVEGPPVELAERMRSLAAQKREETRAMFAELAETMTAREIAEHLGRQQSSVRRSLARCGLKAVPEKERRNGRNHAV